jgi:hypothetical protein
VCVCVCVCVVVVVFVVVVFGVFLRQDHSVAQAGLELAMNVARLT